MKLLPLFLLALLYTLAPVFSLDTAPKSVEAAPSFKPAEFWLDNNGTHINAHGGGILYDKGVYYWYGTHMEAAHGTATVGIKVYSSSDLYHWQDEGVVLPVRPMGSGHILESGCRMERPKVIFNAKTQQYVMWFHLEHKDKGYAAAEYAVAVSDSPTGVFRFLHHGRSCAGLWPSNMSAEQIKALQESQNPSVAEGKYLLRDFKKGQMSRDMTLFVDEDGSAYHIFSSEENSTLHIAQLSDDYLEHSGEYVRVLPQQHNEAPALFKQNGFYWMISSGCTGWAPNAARLSRARSPFGPWESLPNPFQGEGAERSFDSQSTHILRIEGKKDAWIYMGDRWTPQRHIDALHIWLPLEFKKGVPCLQWQEQWDLSHFEDASE